MQPLPAPRPRPFPCVGGGVPGPRCGHTLTAVSGPEGDFSGAKLIMFGERVQPHATLLASVCWYDAPSGLICSVCMRQGEPQPWRARSARTGRQPHLAPHLAQACPPLTSSRAASLQCGMTSRPVRRVLCAQAGSGSDSAAGIRLAGATNDVHIMDVRSGKWEKMVPQGEPPSPRAAHAAAAVGSMVVVQVCSHAGNPF